MSHHKVCPFCGCETRCPWEQRNVEEPCYQCEPTFAAGFDAAIRLFWQGVCEADALDFDAQASRCDLETHNARALRPPSQHFEETAVTYERRATRSRARAAELRAWASGALSAPTFDERRTR